MSESKISSTQIVTFLLSGMVGSGIINIPASLAKAVHQEAWIPSLIGGLFIFILVNIGLSIFRQYPNQNILELGETLLGRIPGRCFSLLFFLYYYLLTSISVRISVDFISTWILPATPIDSMIILFIFSAVLIAHGGLRVLIRFAEITTFLLLPFIVILLIPFTKWDILNLLPVAAQPVTAYFTGSLHSIYSYLGFELIFFIIPFIGTGFKQLRRTANLTILSVILIYSLFTVFTILAFGYNYVQNQIYTAIKYIQLIQFPVIERVEFIAVFFWIFALFSTFVLMYFFGYKSLQFTFSMKNDLWLIPYSVPIYFIALLPQSVPEVGTVAEQLSVVSILVIVAIILTLKIASLFKRKRKERR